MALNHKPMHRLPSIQQIVDRTKYKVVKDGKVLAKDLAYTEAISTLNRLLMEHGAGARLVIQ